MASDLEAALVNSVKALDPDRPIGEVDMNLSMTSYNGIRKSLLG